MPASSASSVRAHSAAEPCTTPRDAVEILEAGHRQLEEWFTAFEGTQELTRRAELARRICHAWKVHATIEEEIFHPAFLDATCESDMHHEAEVGLAATRNLIQQLEAAGLEDEHFGDRVVVLARAIRDHVLEEERCSGMFAEARRAGMDLRWLGRQMQRRKDEMNRALH